MPQDRAPAPRHLRRGTPRRMEEELARERDRMLRGGSSDLHDAWRPTKRGTHAAEVVDTAFSASDTAEADVAPSGESPRSGRVGSFRPELQGLRAVAILMVVCYHIWFDRVSGGVDIFLLISAFLLTGSFTRKLESGRPLAVPMYWLHAFKRLVPPGALVILLTVVASLLILPATRWVDLLGDAVASLTYGENWLLASRSVDYYAADHSTASPLQHYWSLSIQGQVFLLWPALFLLAWFLVTRFRLPARRTLLLIFGGIAVVSFVWSVYSTGADQAFAYFDTRTRLWEFALGSILALVLPSIERRMGYRQHADALLGGARTLRGVTGWVGLALILACGWVVDVQGAFPGWIALWPLLSACLVLASGPTGLSWGADRVLSSRPLQWLGDISYALYLAHWPLLILTLVALDRSSLGPVQGTLVVAAAIVLAWAITRFVDAPIRFSPRLELRWWRSALVIVVSAALVLAVVGGVRGTLSVYQASIEAKAERNNPGARSLQAGFVSQAEAGAPPLPDLAQLPDDWFSVGGSCRGPFAPKGADEGLTDSCSQDGSGRGDTLVVVGDSRDQQLAPAIASIAGAQGWSVVTLLSGGCPFTIGESVDDTCNAHNSTVLEYLLRTSPTAVMSSSTLVNSSFHEEVMSGHDDLAGSLLSAGIDVIGSRDIPRLNGNPVECLETEDANRESCVFPVEDEYDFNELPVSAPDGAGPGRYYSVDLSEQICPGRECVPEIGNVYVWLDGGHITARYAATLAPALSEQLAAQGWVWER